MIKVKRPIRLARENRGRRRIASKPTNETPVAEGRIPRVSRLMALAIRFDGLLEDGLIVDQSELARLAKVTQPRMTQIMNLLHLAPDIQEEILFLPPVIEGRDPIHEKMLRPVTAEICWKRQRALWGTIRKTAS